MEIDSIYDLSKLIKFLKKWQFVFNLAVCKYLHTGYGNEDMRYTVGDTVLCTIVK